MRVTQILIILAAPLFVFGQDDSNVVVERPALEVRIGVMGDFDLAPTSAEALRQLSKRPELDMDFSGFSENGSYRLYHPPVFINANICQPLRNTKSFLLSAGLLFRQDHFTRLGYYREKLTPVDVLAGDSSGTTLEQFEYEREDAMFTITGYQICAPLGVYWRTNHGKRLSFQAGLCLAPGISFGHRLRYEYYFNIQDMFVPPGAEPNPVIHTYPSYENAVSSSFSDPINGLGFTSYGSVPVTLLLRLSTSDNFFGRVHLFLNLEPCYVYESFKSMTIFRSSGTRLGAGIRAGLQ